MSTDQLQNINVFAQTNFRNMQRKFGIKTDDRRRHVYIIGKTGMGKSVLEENMIFNDIRAGHGLAIVDPHGDLAEAILDVIPSHRVNDVVYFNPSDVDYPVAFNPLESVDPKYRHLVASGLVGVFKKIWADSWGPRLEYILRNAILALLEYPNSTLLGITRILVDKYYRKKVLEKVSDPVVRSFWIDEYDNYNEKFRTEAISPIQNKIGQFLSSSIIRNIVGQPKSTIDLREIMDNKKILILNLSKGRVGEDNSGLLGAMMITKIQLSAMSRIDTLEEAREDFFLYVDEFQNFATESFANILSEARKYRLNITIAHQYIEQLGDVVKAAVFGNVGTMITFRVGAEDAEFLEKEFGPTFTEEDLVGLPKYHIYLKLMIDGITSESFSAVTLPPVATKNKNREKIIKVSRERYSKTRQQVEEKILRWAGVEDVFKETATAESGSLDEEELRFKHKSAAPSQSAEVDMPRLNLTKTVQDLYEAECWVCHRKLQLPFKPDGIRPIYCKEDMKKVRQGLITKPKPPLVVVQGQPLNGVPDSLPTVEEEDYNKIKKPTDVDDFNSNSTATSSKKITGVKKNKEIKLSPDKLIDPLPKVVSLSADKPQIIKPNQVIHFEE
ncbi:DUF87 domain-containing protein [Patescibacteria group bacterium]|nr:DUF87 domain-containing protein [Patescibacteria group bacterium]